MMTNKAKNIMPANAQKMEVPEEKSEEQLAYERKITIARINNDLRMIERERLFKQIQIDGTVVERNESKYYNGSTFTKDDIKPKFILENEVDILTQRKKELLERIGEITKLENENAGKTTKS